MSLTPNRPTAANADRLTTAASALGYEIVDIAGFLDLVEEHAKAQSGGLRILQARGRDMTAANADVLDAAKSMTEYTGATVADVEGSAARVRRSGEQTRAVAQWVQNVSSRTEHVADTLVAVKTNNQQIASIANQVNTLAINAKIEAARAGDAGRGFAVVAEAINELSRQTRDAAVQISNNIETLTDWIATLGGEAEKVSEQATAVIEDTNGTDTALGRIETSINSADCQARRIAEQADRVATAVSDFTPELGKIETAIKGSSSGIEETRLRVLRLIDTSETIVQSTALLSEDSVDAPFIRTVLQLSERVSEAMDAAISEGRTTPSKLFDRTYRPIPNTNPEQVLTEFTALMDDILPQIQEPVLTTDPRIVFCAAVDENGYLPTHNKKFSQPPSDDPVWNTANCRNRRIFDDRVGLKAGRNKEPFLLQVYRRDMGGGTFKMMKDLSAPIRVQGRHWGGLRLAYSFE
ncbi:MAG: methyl-accepting chemotaxis protein [Pseudomonadota bacterium]